MHLSKRSIYGVTKMRASRSLQEEQPTGNSDTVKEKLSGLDLELKLSWSLFRIS